MVAIISALSSAPINRLKFTKALISKQASQMLTEMESFFSSSNNFKTYRDAIAEGLVDGFELPTIPHMALFLQDLTFIADGNASTIKGIINFEQKTQVYQVVNQIMKMQSKADWQKRLLWTYFKWIF